MTAESRSRHGPSLTVGEVAVRMNIPKASVRRLITHGHMKRMRGFNHEWRVSVEEFDRYMLEAVTE